MLLRTCTFSAYGPASHLDLHSFPTRRSSDLIIIERFWRNIKYEEVYLKDYESPREARLNIRDYIDFYNYNRPHQSLDYKTPSSRSEEHTSELQSRENLVCRLLLEKKNKPHTR